MPPKPGAYATRYPPARGLRDLLDARVEQIRLGILPRGDCGLALFATLGWAGSLFGMEIVGFHTGQHASQIIGLLA